MKKILCFTLCVMLTVILFAAMSFADSTSTGVTTPTAVPATSPLFTSLNGDMVYVPLKHTEATGVTTTIASFDNGLIELKAGPMVDLKGTPSAAGVISVSLPKLISLIGGTWAPTTFTVDIETGSLIYFTGKGAIQPSIGAAVIKIPL